MLVDLDEHDEDGSNENEEEKKDWLSVSKHFCPLSIGRVVLNFIFVNLEFGPTFLCPAHLSEGYLIKFN